MESSPSITQEESSAIWTEAFKVRAFEMDASGCLSMPAMCNYFQEAAGNHARKLGVSIEQLRSVDLTWMLSRLHVQVHRYPSGGDTVFVDTWPSGHDGLYATREFRLFTEAGDEVALATSAWLMIDLNRMRPLRVPDFIDGIPVPDIERAIADPFDKMIPPERTTILKHFEVRYGDLDVNQHANNVAFIEWALESIPNEARAAHRLDSLEIHYRSQAQLGDIILSKARQQSPQPLVIHHVLYGHTHGDRELAVVRTRWG